MFFISFLILTLPFLFLIVLLLILESGYVQSKVRD